MSLRAWFERFIGQPSQAIPVAVVLALLPIPHWLGILLATVVLLRSGGPISYIGFVFVLFAAYASEMRYNFSDISLSFEPFMTLYAPIGVMAFVLRMTRQLALSLAVGAWLIAGVVIVLGLLEGFPSVESMLAFFEHRRSVMGYTELDAIAELYQMPLEQSAFIILLIWPFLYFIFQAFILLMARYAQSLLYVKGGFARDFHGIRLNKVTAGVFGIVFLAEFFLPNGMEMVAQSPEYVMIAQLSGVAFGLLGIAGLGMAHWYVAFRKMGSWVLILLYASIFLLGPVILPGLVVLALADAGVDLRRRVTTHSKRK